MKVHRLTGFLLVFVMLASMLAACAAPAQPPAAQPPAAEPPAAEPPAAAEPAQPAAPQSEAPAVVDPLGKYDPPITISLSGVERDPNKEPIGGQTDTDNAWLTAYKDELGITFKEYWVVQPDRVEEKTNLAIASGDIPDLMYLTRRQFEMLVENGLAADLTDVWDQYATDLTKKIMNADGGRCLEMSHINGRLYAIPWTNGYVDRTPVIWIRGDWLEKVGMEKPTNLAELEAVMDAFVNQDPDGNGVADTVGIATTMSLLELQSIFSAFHSYPNSWIKGPDGNLVYGGIQPETKTALERLATWYQKGYIHREFGALGWDKFIEQISAGTAGVAVGMWWYPAWPLNFTRNNNPEAEWVSVPVLSADDKPALALADYGPEGYYVVRADFEHPEAAVKMINLWFEKMYAPGADIEKYNKTAEGGELFWYAKMLSWRAHEDYEAFIKIREAMETGDTSKLIPLEKHYYDGVMAYINGNADMYTQYKMYGPESALGSLEYNVTNNYFMFNEYYGTGTPTMQEKSATLDKLQLETFVKIIMGEEPADYFDQFVSQWKSLGGDQITIEVNEWYRTK